MGCRRKRPKGASSDKQLAFRIRFLVDEVARPEQAPERELKPPSAQPEEQEPAEFNELEPHLGERSEQSPGSAFPLPPVQKPGDLRAQQAPQPDDRLRGP